MHLGENKEALSILELGLCLIHAYQKLKFYLEEAEKISSGVKLNINEIVILHIVRIQKSRNQLPLSIYSPIFTMNIL